jgi:hypothetical protein
MLESISLLAWLLAEAGFVASPPEDPPISIQTDEIMRLDLRLVEDAIGLAYFIEDDGAARAMEKAVESQLARAREVLAADPRWQELDRQQSGILREMFADRLRSSAEILAEIGRFPAGRSERIIAGWLRKIFWQAGVYLERDITRLSQPERDELCRKLSSRLEPGSFEPWRLRILLWQLRDREALRLHHLKDEREAEITSFSLDLSRLEGDSYQAWKRYGELLQRLRQLSARHGGDDAEARTLRGFLRGLRYMPTIRQACQTTGLDHRLITRLFIQESAFVHQRISHAGAYSLAQFLDIALKDIWQFRNKIPGAQMLLENIQSYDELRRLVIDDPRWAIRAACVYFRRLRDEAELRLGNVDNENMLAIMSLELFAVRRGLAEQGELESQLQAGLLGQERSPTPPSHWTGWLSDAGQALAAWVEGAARQLAARHLSQELFRQRLDRLYEALGLAAYNAGMGNLRRTADRVGAAGRLAFPLQIGETRAYINEILNGRDYLGAIQEQASPLRDLDYTELARLVGSVCKRPPEPKNKIALPDSHQSQSTGDPD